MSEFGRLKAFAFNSQSEPGAAGFDLPGLEDVSRP